VNPLTRCAGTIGTGLFVGSGQALAIGGPGFLLLAYILTSLLVYGVVTAVIEVGTFLPVSGSSMSFYCARYVSPSLGFALGWLYFYSFGILVAYEITAASIVIDFWPSKVPIAVWITIMLIVIVALNLSPVGIYAETEFWFAGIKIIMIIGLLILSFVLMLGGGPQHDRLGFRYWNNPGAFQPHLIPGSGGRFTSFLYVWVFCGFSFYFGPELIIFTGGEMRNPRKNLPIASRRYFIRLVFFYVLGALAIGIICPSNAEDLTSGAGNANASPWVVAIRNARIAVLPSIVNAGILCSAWSAGNAYLYMSSRSLYSMAVAGSAPKIFTRCTRYGLPIYAVLASSCFAFLAYLNVSSNAGVVFNWFISLTNTAGYTSWIVCAIIFLRFRKACETQGVTVPYRSHVQPWAAWICIPIFAFLLLANGFTVFYPGQFTVSGFLVTYLGIPIFLGLWLAHKFTAGRNMPWIYAPADVDLTTGVREVEADAEAWTRMDMQKRDGGGGGSKNAWWKKISVVWS
jgi:amino acid transporter